ncbi:hypothetical protein FJZ31_40530 [Candidatus Poribacteria bacterium]|nr:hypothetical protein [Candidatus Poribacteria bacterium]
MKKTIAIGISILALGVLLSPFASKLPDGLEAVAEKLGFLEKASPDAVLHSPLPDYSAPGVNSEYWGTVLSGTIGALIMFGGGYALAQLLKKRKNQ